MIPRTIKYSFIVISFFLVFLLVSALNDYDYVLKRDGWKLVEINNEINTLEGEWQKLQIDRLREAKFGCRSWIGEDCSSITATISDAEFAEHKRKLAALEAEKEKMKSDIRIRQNESWDKVEFYLFSIFSLVFSFVVYFIIRKNREINNKIKEEKKRAKEEAERLERDRKRKEREEEEWAQRVRLQKWTYKNEKLERSINSIRSSLEEIKNQKPILNQQIEKLELEKKAIEENISQLSDDIKGEKKIVKELRKKYPFIDSYIENR